MMQNDSQHESCLVTLLSHYMALSPEELDHIERFESEEQDLDANRQVHSRGDSLEHLYVVKSGWLLSSTDIADGRRHIVQIHHPGDMLALQDLSFGHHTTDLFTIESCTLCPFPRSALTVVMQDAPRLGALLICLVTRQSAIMVDVLRATGRMYAKERVTFLLLMLLHRLRVTNPDMDDTLRLPITQTQIGDFLGLTNVSVSKAMSELQRDGFISRHRDRVTLHRVDELVDGVQYVDRYGALDTSWFPESE